MLWPMTRVATGGAVAIACALALALATGCGSQPPTASAPPTPAPASAPSGATPEARAGLEQALGQLATDAGASGRARLLVEAIARAIAPGDDCLTSFAGGGAAAAVRAACPADAGKDASVGQLVLDHAGKVLATAYAGADTGALEQRLAALPVRLPLPAKSSVCELPAVAGVDASGDFARTYVLLGSDRAVHAGRVPMATVRPGGVAVSVNRGASFPGEVVSTVAGSGELADANAVAPAVARLRGGAPEPPAADGTMKKKEAPAKGQHAIESAGTQPPLAQAPVLMLVDRRASALESALLAQQLLWSVLAVAGPNGTAAALPVHLRVAPPGERGAQPVIALTAETVMVGVTGSPDVAKLARVPDGAAAPAGLTDALAAARARAPASADVRLMVDGPASVVELAQILGAVHSAGVGAVTIEVGVLKHAPAAKPSVRITAVKVKGRLNAPAVERALGHRRDQLLACFAEQLQSNPELAGTVSVDFIVAPTGQSAGAHAKGLDPKVAACVGQVTDSLRFPRPKGAASVSYKLVFARTGG